MFTFTDATEISVNMVGGCCHHSPYEHIFSAVRRVTAGTPST